MPQPGSAHGSFEGFMGGAAWLGAVASLGRAAVAGAVLVAENARSTASCTDFRGIATEEGSPAITPPALAPRRVRAARAEAREDRFGGARVRRDSELSCARLG